MRRRPFGAKYLSRGEKGSLNRSMRLRLSALLVVVLLPAAFPGGVASASTATVLTVDPPSQTRQTGSQASILMRVLDENGQPVSGAIIEISRLGVNDGEPPGYNLTTNAAGEAVYSYVGTVDGPDDVQAQVVGSSTAYAQATVTWTSPAQEGTSSCFIVALSLDKCVDSTGIADTQQGSEEESDAVSTTYDGPITDSIEVTNSGDCENLRVHVRLVGDPDPTIERQMRFDVNLDCTVTAHPVEELLLGVTPGPTIPGPGRSATASNTYYYNYHHSSHTLQDGINIDVAKVRLVDKRFWNGSSTWLDDPWCYSTCRLYGVVGAYTGKSWNHITGVDFPYINRSCRHNTSCSNTYMSGRGRFHTDWVWCNRNSESQTIEMTNRNYTRRDGAYWTDFYTNAPCAGMHHATKVSANLKSGVNDL